MLLLYVESNFVLEAALQQEDNQTIQELIALAETNQLKLKLPALALIEPYWTLGKTRETRNNLYNSLLTLSNQFQRSNLHKEVAPTVVSLRQEIRESTNKELISLENTIQRLLAVSELIDISTAVYLAALSYRVSYSFEDFQDAVMYSAIVTDLKQQEVTEPKCFVSLDVQAFGNRNQHEREIKDELSSYGCRVITQFQDALSFVKSSLNLS